MTWTWWWWCCWGCCCNCCCWGMGITATCCWCWVWWCWCSLGCWCTMWFLCWCCLCRTTAATAAGRTRLMPCAGALTVVLDESEEELLELLLELELELDELELLLELLELLSEDESVLTLDPVYGRCSLFFCKCWAAFWWTSWRRCSLPRWIGLWLFCCSWWWMCFSTTTGCGAQTNTSKHHTMEAIATACPSVRLYVCLPGRLSTTTTHGMPSHPNAEPCRCISKSINSGTIHHETINGKRKCKQQTSKQTTNKQHNRQAQQAIDQSINQAAEAYLNGSTIKVLLMLDVSHRGCGNELLGLDLLSLLLLGVGRREHTEGDRNAGVVVQFG
ncbi:hypothetical protein DFH27DRAFT_108930 [Peziza echinospora]|nr:hypothetical protein DFH27DRAFT_108930 [Peziza echinospora]